MVRVSSRPGVKNYNSSTAFKEEHPDSVLVIRLHLLVSLAGINVYGWFAFTTQACGTLGTFVRVSTLRSR